MNKLEKEIKNHDKLREDLDKLELEYKEFQKQMISNSMSYLSKLNELGEKLEESRNTIDKLRNNS